MDGNDPVPDIPGLKYSGFDRQNTNTWHRYTYDEELGKGVQGRLNQVIYPLLNIWGNWVDKNTA